MSKFDSEAKEPYSTVSMYLPDRLIQAMDRLAKRYPAMNRSKIAEITIRADLEIQAELREMEEGNE